MSRDAYQDAENESAVSAGLVLMKWGALSHYHVCTYVGSNLSRWHANQEIGIYIVRRLPSRRDALKMTSIPSVNNGLILD